MARSNLVKSQAKVVTRERAPLPSVSEALNRIPTPMYKTHANVGGCKRVSARAPVYYKHAFAWLVRELARRLVENVVADKRWTVFPTDVQHELACMQTMPRVVAGIACAMPRRKRSRGEASAESAATTTNEVKPQAASKPSGKSSPVAAPAAAPAPAPAPAPASKKSKSVAATTPAPAASAGSGIFSTLKRLAS